MIASRYPSGTVPGRTRWNRTGSGMTRLGKVSTRLRNAAAAPHFDALAKPFHRGRISPHFPSPPVPTFLTVKEAAHLTGKSPSSIRRLIYPIIEDDNHPDRSHIEPSVEQAHALRVKGEQFAWKLSEDLLRRLVPQSASPGGEKGAPSSRESTGDGTLLAILRSELEIKNQQITQQMELINSLSERLREGNILIGSLQSQLALPKPRDKNVDATDAKRGDGGATQKSTKGAAKREQKKSFFGRLFG